MASGQLVIMKGDSVTLYSPVDLLLLLREPNWAGDCLLLCSFTKSKIILKWLHYPDKCLGGVGGSKAMCKGCHFRSTLIWLSCLTGTVTHSHSPKSTESVPDWLRDLICFSYSFMFINVVLDSHWSLNITAVLMLLVLSCLADPVSFRLR